MAQTVATKLARAGRSGATREPERDQGEGRVHVVPSTKETVQLGVYNTNLLPILTIDSGDSISFSETWSHFLNELQPGVPIDTLAKLWMNTLCSIAVSFRVTQVVDIVRGVHALIPKNIFAGQLRQQMTVV